MPSQNKMETIEDANSKPKEEISPTNEFSLINPISEEGSIQTPLQQEPSETTSKVNFVTNLFNVK